MRDERAKLLGGCVEKLFSLFIIRTKVQITSANLKRTGAMHNIAHRPQNMEEPPSPKKYGESKSKRPVSAPSAMLATLAPLGA